PHRLLVGVFIDQGDGGAELDGVAGELADIDDIGAREFVLDLGNAALIMRLLLLGGVIFRVFGEIAMRARFGNMLDDTRALDRLALLQLVLKRGIAESGHRYLFHHLPSSFNLMRANRGARTNAESEPAHGGRVPAMKGFNANRYRTH